jgi:hypothetical protein
MFFILEYMVRSVHGEYSQWTWRPHVPGASPETPQNKSGYQRGHSGLTSQTLRPILIRLRGELLSDIMDDEIRASLSLALSLSPMGIPMDSMGVPVESMGIPMESVGIQMESLGVRMEVKCSMWEFLYAASGLGTLPMCGESAHIPNCS